jgi:hypothetical protein
VIDPARERRGVDRVCHGLSASTEMNVQITSVEQADLPSDYFDLIFVSNFLEHLPEPDGVASLPSEKRALLRLGLVVAGPNFQSRVREYFGCADHALVLTHRSVAEHLHGILRDVGLGVDDVVPRFGACQRELHAQRESPAWPQPPTMATDLAWRRSVMPEDLSSPDQAWGTQQ